MPRPISKIFLAKAEALKEQISDLIDEASTVDQAGHLQVMLDDAAVWADEKVCQLDN
jgi:hypothetical protein